MNYRKMGLKIPQPTNFSVFPFSSISLFFYVSYNLSLRLKKNKKNEIFFLRMSMTLSYTSPSNNSSVYNSISVIKFWFGIFYYKMVSECGCMLEKDQFTRFSSCFIQSFSYTHILGECAARSRLT